MKARLKQFVRGLAAPLGGGLARLGISADAVTWAGVVAAGIAAWGFVRGDRPLALGALLASGLCDLLDGAVALPRVEGRDALVAVLGHPVRLGARALFEAQREVDGERLVGDALPELEPHKKPRPEDLP